MSQLITILATILLCFNTLQAQIIDYKFQNFTKEDGLPSNETYCVFKDSKDYIWVGTDRGVVRYNGISFQKFNLPDNVVFKIKEDKKGKIWFFTFSSKLAYFWNEKIYPYEYNDSIQKNITKILIDDAYLYDNGDIYLKSLLETDFLIKSDGTIKTFRLKKHKLGEKKNYDTVSISNFTNEQLFIQIKASAVYNNFTVFQDFINNKTYTHIENSEKAISITKAIKTNTNSIIYFQKNQVYKIINSKLEYIDFPNEILSMTYNTKSNSILLGLKKNGIIELNENLQIVKKYRLNDYSISSICASTDNIIWATSLEKGIFKINTTTDYKSDLQLITSAEYNSISEFNNKLLLSNNKGIFDFSGNNKTTLFFPYSNTNGSFLANASNSLLLFSCITEKKIQLYRRLRRIKEVSILILENEKKTRIYKKNYYLLHGNTGLTKYKILLPNNNYSYNSRLKIDSILTYESGLRFSDTQIRDAVIYNDSTVLVGTLNGIYACNTKTNTREQFLQNNSLLKSGISQIEPFMDDIYALGIRFNGIALIKDKNILTQISEKEGILSNSIRYIYPDSTKLWLATDNGISCISFQSFSPIKYTIKNFGKEVGLGNEIIYQIIRVKKDILAATSKGIFKLTNADSLLVVPPKPIPFYITTIATYLGDSSNISNINLPYNKSRVSINFDAIEFTIPKDIEYYYRIANNDSSWFRISNPQLILQDLAPGIYEVELKARLPKQGRISTIQKLTITIEKPWWQKNSIRGLAAVLLALSIYLFSNWRIKKAKRIAEEKNEIANKMLRLEQAALRSQMNPHFIFNCLTSIQQLINTGNKNEADTYLVKFSRLIRKTLEYSSKEYILLDDEITYLKEYGELELLRMSNKFEMHINCNQNISTTSVEIPSMLLQPIVENAIRHGINPLVDRKGIININFSPTEEYLSCTINDNGIGLKNSTIEKNKFDQFSSHKSFGLAITKQRLEAYSKQQEKNYSIAIKDVSESNTVLQGTIVTINLPYKNL